MGVRRWFHPPGRNRRTDSGASVTFDELRLCGHRRRACACRPATLHYSKSSSTLFVRLPQARRLPSIHGPTIALMLPPDGWRLEAELYSPASNKTSSPPQARRVLRFAADAQPVVAGSRSISLELADFRVRNFRATLARWAKSR